MFDERTHWAGQRLNKKDGPSHDFATLCNEYGLYLKRQNKAQEAMRLFMRAVEMWSRVWGPEHLLVANAQLNLCTVCYSVGSLQQVSEDALCPCRPNVLLVLLYPALARTNGAKQAEVHRCQAQGARGCKNVSMRRRTTLPCKRWRYVRKRSDRTILYMQRR